MSRRLTLTLPGTGLADMRARATACRRGQANVAIARPHLAALLRDHACAIVALGRDVPPLACTLDAFEALHDRLERTERTNPAATVPRAALEALLADHATLLKALGADRATRAPEGGRA